MQEPKTISLGTTLRYKGVGSTRQLVDVEESFEYVPLIENLEALLNNVEVLKEVRPFVIENYLSPFPFQVSKSHIRNDGLLGDFCDGSLYKNHPLFSKAGDDDGTLYLQFIV